MSEAAHELAMRPAGAGTIVNVTVSPHHGMPAMAHTGAARAAVEAMTRELAERWAAGRRGRGRGGPRPAGHRVAAQVPGRAVAQGGRQSVPLQRLGEMEEYGWLVALLATPLGRALSGSVVTLDGGARQLAGSLAARGAHARRRGADRGAPAAR